MKHGGNCAQHGTGVGRDSVGGHDPLGEGIVGLPGPRGARATGEQVQRRHLRARALRKDVDEAEVVHVLIS